MSDNRYCFGVCKMSRRNITSDDINYTMNENTMERLITRHFQTVMYLL